MASVDNKYDENVQKLIEVGKEKGYLLYDEVSDLLLPEGGGSPEDLDELFLAFGWQFVQPANGFDTDTATG